MITKNSELQSAMADWLNRDDLTAQIPVFVSFFESDANRSLRVRDMLMRAMLTWTSEVAPLPLDFLETYDLEETYPPSYENKPPLRYVGWEELKQIKSDRPQGTTRWYTIYGGYIELWPPPQLPTPPETGGFPMTMVYYQKIPPLVASTDTNWLLAKSPQAYLYGSLLHAAPYLKNDERIPTWQAMAGKALEDLRMESERSMRPATTLVARKRNFGR